MATREPPRVAILYNDCEQLLKGEPRDIVADRGVVLCAQAVAEALRSAGIETAMAPISTRAEAALRDFPPMQWVVYNLGEGLAGLLFEEVRIAWALEVMGYRFTGADAQALSLTTHKARAKEALQRAGVPTPAWRVFSDPARVEPGDLDGLRFPLFVKPVAEDASLGISEQSVVHTLADLRTRVGYVTECYHQAALVEAFADGREINVSLWGEPPLMLPLSEVIFEGIADPYACTVPFAAKWEPDSYAWKHSPAVCPAVVSPALKQSIAQTALRAWQALGCRGYARVDMRVDRHDVPYVLEVNCNPDISPDAGFFRSVQAAGYTYPEMVLRILHMATDWMEPDERTRTTADNSH
jgi:D-alanine-D-alanine ligase